MTSLQDQDSYTSYHMKCINGMKWTCLSRSVIYRDSATGYFISPSPLLSQIVFFTYFINTLVKLLFLALLVTDHLGPIEFLDRICGMDYLLCGGMVLLSYIIWQRYPLYEIIYRLWEVENCIFKSLGSPKGIRKEAKNKHFVTVWSHAILTCIGCCSLMIQFYSAPKYCVFTYSLVETDNSYLRMIFCFHEVLFLSHAWFAMACSNGLCSFEAVNLSKIIKEMSKALNELDKVGKLERLSIGIAEGHNNGGIGKNGSALGKEKASAFLYSDKEDGEDPLDNDNNMKGKSKYKSIHIQSAFSTRRKPRSNSSGRRFRQILYYYQQLMLVSERFNSWIGYKIVFLSIIAFCQYISSTTMAFQVLRMPGTGIGDIWFYIQDCTVAVYVTFRVFDYMSIVLPASDQFFTSVRYYQINGAGRYLQKFIKTLRPVCLKIGPNPMRRETVLKTMEMLANYYVCVALW